MKKYVRSATRVKQINESESNDIRQMILHDFVGFSEDDIIFLGTYQDYKGRRAYKYNLKSEEYGDDFEWVIPTEHSYDMSDNFDDIATRWGDEVTFPRMPKKSPVNGWPPMKSIELENDFGDKSTYDIIRSRDGAIKFLFGCLRDREFPMMLSSYYQGDVEYYEELMRNFDNGGHVYDEDTRTDFYANGTMYSIDDEMELKDAIEIYYAIPNVESLIQTNSACDIIWNGYLYRDEAGYWYSDMGECRNPDDWEEVINV